MHDKILSIHAAATTFLVGLIWFVQVVHYPLMAQVGRENAIDYALAHQRRTSWVVGPAMLVEAFTAAWIALSPSPFGVDPIVAWCALGLLALVWAVTAFVSVPLHARLARGRDGDAVRRLVATNWLRTGAWTARGVAACWMLGA